MADLISRAAAIAEIEEYIEEYSELEPETGYHNLKWCAMEEAKDVLSMLPAVDAAPVVHGNWIECYERSRHYYCSNCGKVQGIASIVMKYCPECGAKMAEHPWAGRYTDQSGAEYADNPTV